MISVLLNLFEETPWETITSCATLSTIFFIITMKVLFCLKTVWIFFTRSPFNCLCAALRSKFTTESHLDFYRFVKYFFFPHLVQKKNVPICFFNFFNRHCSFLSLFLLKPYKYFFLNWGSIHITNPYLIYKLCNSKLIDTSNNILWDPILRKKKNTLSFCIANLLSKMKYRHKIKWNDYNTVFYFKFYLARSHTSMLSF